MSDNLLELAIATTGGRELRKTLRGLRIDISIGGPIWAMKGWPPEKTFDQILTLDTVKEHIVFTPFTRSDQQMVFDAATDSVTMQTLDGQCRGCGSWRTAGVGLIEVLGGEVPNQLGNRVN